MGTLEGFLPEHPWYPNQPLLLDVLTWQRAPGSGQRRIQQAVLVVFSEYHASSSKHKEQQETRPGEHNEVRLDSRRITIKDLHDN